MEEVRVEKLAEKVKVYNLEVENLHVYYVAGVMVHNKCVDEDTIVNSTELAVDSNNMVGLQSLIDMLRNGKKTHNGNNSIFQLDEKTKIIFRMDVGEFAHKISSKGYNNPINHLNIEIQTRGTSGKYKTKWDFHLIFDDIGNIIDKFELGVWTK